jgi:hypothetical protein
MLTSLRRRFRSEDSDTSGRQCEASHVDPYFACVWRDADKSRIGTASPPSDSENNELKTMTILKILSRRLISHPKNTLQKTFSRSPLSLIWRILVEPLMLLVIVVPWPENGDFPWRSIVLLILIRLEITHTVNQSEVAMTPNQGPTISQTRKGPFRF